MTSCNLCQDGQSPTTYTRIKRGQYVCPGCERDISMALHRMNSDGILMDLHVDWPMESIIGWAWTVALAMTITATAILLTGGLP